MRALEFSHSVQTDRGRASGAIWLERTGVDVGMAYSRVGSRLKKTRTACSSRSVLHAGRSRALRSAALRRDSMPAQLKEMKKRADKLDCCVNAPSFALKNIRMALSCYVAKLIIGLRSIAVHAISAASGASGRSGPMFMHASTLGASTRINPWS